MTPYINVYFVRPDGSDIAMCSLPVGAWLPVKGDPITLCQNVCIQKGSWKDNVEGVYEDRRTAAVVGAARYELFWTEGGHSEVRYLVEVHNAAP